MTSANSRLKAYVGLLIVLAWAGTMIAFPDPASSAPASEPTANNAPAQAPAQKCPSPTPPSSITSALATPPTDVCAEPNQVDLDLFSWLSFVAMNWPANTATCTANASASILTGKSPTVWETYLTDSQLIPQNPNPSQPPQWCQQGSAAKAVLNQALASLPSAQRQRATRLGVTKVLGDTSKAQDDLTENLPSMAQAVGGVLADLNGRFVRYEIRDNKVITGYVVQNKLWYTQGQQQFNRDASFPPGAMELKAAWKVLGQGDDPTKFYTTWAIVYNNDSGAASPQQQPIQLGLVGLHIMTKTVNQPFWIWSTFEHVNNAPPKGQASSSTHYNFYNPACTNCVDNSQTVKNAHPDELNTNGQPIWQAAQVSRVNPIPNPPTALNALFQRLLGGSVWANYQLVSTQWVAGIPSNNPTLVPGWLANLTMETWNQGPNPPTDNMPDGKPYNPFNPDPTYRSQYNPFATNDNGFNGLVSSSCMKCHQLAGFSVPGQGGGSTFLSSDFVFVLGGAQSASTTASRR
jgi:hypothetical protein